MLLQKHFVILHLLVEFALENAYLSITKSILKEIKVTKIMDIQNTKLANENFSN